MGGEGWLRVRIDGNPVHEATTAKHGRLLQA
jgi:hypothetical protein